MSEYFDYLMNAVDLCHQKLSKALPEAPPNPLSVWQGKIEADTICPSCQTILQKEEKDCSLQSCYISLTSLIYPITGISFELFGYDVWSDMCACKA